MYDYNINFQKVLLSKFLLNITARTEILAILLEILSDVPHKPKSWLRPCSLIIAVMSGLLKFHPRLEFT